MIKSNKNRNEFRYMNVFLFNIEKTSENCNIIYNLEFTNFSVTNM